MAYPSAIHCIRCDDRHRAFGAYHRRCRVQEWRRSNVGSRDAGEVRFAPFNRGAADHIRGLLTPRKPRLSRLAPDPRHGRGAELFAKTLLMPGLMSGEPISGKLRINMIATI